MEYSDREQKILDHAISKVRNLFEQYPVGGHGFDHAERTAKWAEEIGVKENSKNIFMCVLSGYLHDIGRAAEYHDLGFVFNGVDQKHHELSYQMLVKWLQEDVELQLLSDEEKTELLYSVRNHWNNEADHYDTAWILRDADKLELFGERGIQRSLEYTQGDPVRLNLGLRLHYDSYYWIKTASARQIIVGQKMMEPVDAFYKEFLRKQIKDV